MGEKHAGNCAVYDFDPEEQLGTDKACDCIYGSKEKIEIPKEMLQRLFDLTVGSMNFGSGFFEDADTQTTREVAEMLGLDPMVGTPKNHQCKYQFGDHEPDLERTWKSAYSDNIIRRWARCKRCHEVTEVPDSVNPG